MTDIHLILSPSDRDLLVRVLGSKLKEVQVGVHRAKFSREFRDRLEGEENQVRELLDKLAHGAETR